METETPRTDGPAQYWITQSQAWLTALGHQLQLGMRRIADHKARSSIGLAIILVLYFSAFFLLEEGPDGREFLSIQILWPLLQIAPLLLLPWSVLLTWFLMAGTIVIGPLNEFGSFGDRPALWLWTAPAMVAYLLVMVIVGLTCDRRACQYVAAGNILALVAPLLLLDIDFLWLAVPITLGALGIGYFAARRGAIIAAAQQELKAQNKIVAEEAAATERARIARELHDVIAHHMSMIAIQAEAAPYKDPNLTFVTQESFSAIRSSSTTALMEMRRVMGMLRPEDEEADLAPQPSIASIPALVDGVRAAGTEISLRIVGIEPDRPPAVDLSVYRIVQEGLSNAVRHSPGSAVRIEILGSAADVRLLVVNGPGTTKKVPTAGSGHGLPGMRERVSLLGGEMVAESTDDGGFTLQAMLPWSGEPTLRTPS